MSYSVAPGFPGDLGSRLGCKSALTEPQAPQERNRDDKLFSHSLRAVN